MRNEMEAEGEPQQRQNDPQEYDTFLYKFQQQIIDAWKPVPHTGSNVVLYIILSAICLGLGLALILSAPNYAQIDVNYTSQQVNGGFVNVTFQVTERMPAPVYFYYGLKGFYQNHRRYMKYFSTDQLEEGTLQPSGVSDSCGDFVTNQQTFGSGAVSYFSGTAGSALTPADTAFPCGTIARAYYKFFPEISSMSLQKINGATYTDISMESTGLAWPSDIGRHKNPSDTSKAAFNIEDERWLVWFRPAVRSDFFKLNGIINTDLQAGSYQIRIDNRVEPTFGEKWISLSKSNFVGNRDLFLGIAFLALGGGCLLLLIVFLAKWISEKRDRQKFN